MENKLINFKPNLSPNNKSDGSDIDWHSRISEPVINWDVSIKLDGIRCEIIFSKDGKCVIKPRSLKAFRSVWIKKLEAQLQNVMFIDIIFEGEIYASCYMFSDIQHIMLSEQVEDYKYEPIRIHLFDAVYKLSQSWCMRKLMLNNHYNTLCNHTDKFELIEQVRFNSVDEILKAFEVSISEGAEGLILKHSNHKYKFGRTTLKQGTYFKMKDESVIYTGIILNILEGTIVDPWAESSINELGYSVTSKLKGDRLPSGKAKGYLVELPNGLQLTVTLSGYTDQDKIQLLEAKNYWINKPIQFIAMKPTKKGGVPRHSKHIK